MKFFNTYEIQTNTVQSQRFPILVKRIEFSNLSYLSPLRRSFRSDSVSLTSYQILNRFCKIYGVVKSWIYVNSISMTSTGKTFIDVLAPYLPLFFLALFFFLRPNIQAVRPNLIRILTNVNFQPTCKEYRVIIYSLVKSRVRLELRTPLFKYKPSFEKQLSDSFYYFPLGLTQQIKFKTMKTYYSVYILNLERTNPLISNLKQTDPLISNLNLKRIYPLISNLKRTNLLISNLKQTDPLISNLK